MTTQHTHLTRAEQRRAKAEAAKREAEHQVRRRRAITLAWITGIALVTAAIVFGLLTSRPTQTSTAALAPTFSLTDTTGQQVSLAAYRGRKNVVLYFNEGAGCQSCIMQMGAIEKQQAAFDKADTVVLPIVMNTKDQIQHDMDVNGVTTPFLLDDGKVSTAYGTIGKGMHAGLPGHSFVLIDKNGTQRWYGEYPSMWLSPDDLLKEITTRLNA